MKDERQHCCQCHRFGVGFYNLKWWCRLHAPWALIDALNYRDKIRLRSDKMTATKKRKEAKR